MDFQGDPFWSCRSGRARGKPLVGSGKPHLLFHQRWLGGVWCWEAVVQGEKGLDEWKILQGTHGFSSSKWRCSSVTISAWANPMKVYTVVPRFQIPELTLVLWLGLTWTRFTRYFPAISGTVIALSESRDLLDSGQAGTGEFWWVLDCVASKIWWNFVAIGFEKGLLSEGLRVWPTSCLD